MSNLLSKITMKSVCGAPEMTTVEIPDGENGTKKALRGVEKLYMRIVGVVRSSRIAKTTFGDSIGFIGEFRAVNIQTGEVFNSGTLFLPNIAETFVANALEGARGKEGFSALEVAFDVGVKPASTPMGYEYTVKPLLEQAQDDFLAQMLGKLPPLALQSPSNESEPKPEQKKGGK